MLFSYISHKPAEIIIFFSTAKLYAIILNYGTLECTDASILINSSKKTL